MKNAQLPPPPPSLPPDARVSFFCRPVQVTDVWGFLGSTANVMVAFTLPCAAYLKIRLHLPRRREKQGGPLYKKWVAGVLVALSVVAGVVCTANNFMLLAARADQGEEP